MTAPPFNHPDAECRGTNPALFYPEQGDTGATIDHAIAICNTCPVRQACLEHALTYNEPGIWGGTTGLQRKAMRAQRLTEPPARNGRGTNYRPVGQTKARILAELHAAGHQWVTLQQLADTLGIQRNSIQKSVIRLRDDGLIDHEYGGYYRLRRTEEANA